MQKLLAALLLVTSSGLLADSLEERIVDAALARTKVNVRYDGNYLSIPYPNGDVPSNIGVCTDVIIRTYRALNIDLQKLVHEDMEANFDVYPSRRIWGLSRTDKNIDHRRVPNLQAFFSRHGESRSISLIAEDYLPGALITWMLPGNLPHVGVVTDIFSKTSGRPLIVHNIGSGPKLEDVLFEFEITGHYRFEPKH